MITDRQEAVVVGDNVGEGGGHGTIKHRSNLNSKHPNKAAIVDHYRIRWETFTSFKNGGFP